MMPKSLGNGQSCNNLATDLISLQHSISPPLILCPSFSSLSLILSLCSVNQTIRGAVCLSLTTLPDLPPVSYHVITVCEDEFSVLQIHVLASTLLFGFIRSREKRIRRQALLAYVLHIRKIYFMYCIKCIKQTKKNVSAFINILAAAFWTNCSCLKASMSGPKKRLTII